MNVNNSIVTLVFGIKQPLAHKEEQSGSLKLVNKCKEVTEEGECANQNLAKYRYLSTQKFTSLKIQKSKFSYTWTFI